MPISEFRPQTEAVCFLVCSVKEIVDEQPLTLEGGKLREWVDDTQYPRVCIHFLDLWLVSVCLVPAVLPTVLDIKCVLQVSVKWPTVAGVTVQQSSEWNSGRWNGAWEDCTGYCPHMPLDGDKEWPRTILDCGSVIRVAQLVSWAGSVGSPHFSDSVLWRSWRTSPSLQVSMRTFVMWISVMFQHIYKPSVI